MLSSSTKLLGALFCGALLLAACGDDTSSAEDSATQPAVAAQAAAVPETTVAPDTAAVPETIAAPETSEAPAADHHADEGEDGHHDDDGDDDGHDEDEDGHDDDSDDHAHEGTEHLAGDADPGDATEIIVIEVVDGAVVGGAQRHDVDSSTVVLIKVTLDAADEVHLHGYDFVVEGQAGETVQIAFHADIPGVWEVELEGAGVELLELEVS